MKKHVLLIINCLLAMFVVCAPASADAPFHIGLVTASNIQAEDEIRGAETLIAIYGSVADGGYIRHDIHPDDFVTEKETSVNIIKALADDPKMKVIVVNQSPPGTSEAFRYISEKRPDILLFAGEAHEDPSVITSAAPASNLLATNADNINRGYTIVYGAKLMGAKNFVHISFPRHMGYETLARSRAIMKEVCRDLGLGFYTETVLDPVDEVEQKVAQQFILNNFPLWLEKYGPDTAFFCTNDALTEPLLKRIAELGGYFVEADLPSPLLGYPGALGLEFTEEEKQDGPFVLKKIEDAVIAAGGSQRMGTWAFSYGYATTTGLAEFGKRIVEGTAKIDNPKDLVACYNKYTPGANWNMAYYAEAKTGMANRQFCLVYQDTYVFGRGYLNLTALEVPEKYYLIDYQDEEQ